MKVNPNKTDEAVKAFTLIVANEIGIKPELVCVKSKKKEIVAARQILQHMLKKYTAESLAEIGAVTGGRDHATVIHACKTVANLSETDSGYNAMVYSCEKQAERFIEKMKSKAKFVLIESPYRNENEQEFSKNIEYAKSALLDSFQRGETPMASHLLYTQVLNEDTTERYEGISRALNWLSIVDSVVVYVDRGVSEGMKMSIDKAKSLNVEVELRTILK